MNNSHIASHIWIVILEGSEMEFSDEGADTVRWYGMAAMKIFF